jgi:enhancing lycopene biosynthesis protein 2
MTRAAVCLSGCGFLDGAEIHESVFTLLALSHAGAEAMCCAPGSDQVAVVNHLKKELSPGEKRNVLVEAARIARGNIKDVASVTAADFDALIFPGGFGAAKNLCSFAEHGPNCDVHPEIQRLVSETLKARKPIGAICIAPAMLARVAGMNDRHPTLTIGNDPGVAAALEEMGARHQESPCSQCVVDEANRIVSAPAYMYDASPAEVYEGIRKLVGEILRLARS